MMLAPQPIQLARSATPNCRDSAVAAMTGRTSAIALDTMSGTRSSLVIVQTVGRSGQPLTRLRVQLRIRLKNQYHVQQITACRTPVTVIHDSAHPHRLRRLILELHTNSIPRRYAQGRVAP